MKLQYAFQQINENMATAFGRDLSISTKSSVEICNSIRGKTVEKATAFLERVISKKSAVPMRRYNTHIPHKTAIGSGKYPINAASEILKILKSAKSNAQNQGLSTKDMEITHISAHHASRPWHYGRQRRRKMKRTHVQIVLTENKIEKPQQNKAEKSQKAVKERSVEQKTQDKPEVKKIVAKEDKK